MFAVPWLIQIELVIEFGLFQIGQQVNSPAQVSFVVAIPIAGGKRVVDVMEIMHRKADLFQPIQLLNSLGLLLRAGRHIFQTSCVHDDPEFFDLLDPRTHILFKFPQERLEDLLAISGFKQPLETFGIDDSRGLSRNDNHGIIRNVLKQGGFSLRRSPFCASHGPLQLLFS